jgi:sRNA-binding carbon storage regulator CsrA
VLVTIGPHRVWVIFKSMAHKGKIVLSFDAPHEVEIVREELLPVEERYRPQGG